MVVWGHSYSTLYGSGRGAPDLWGHSIHTLGIVIFFCISGYLVANSLQSSGNTARFIWKRCLRIFPGLVTCIVISALLVGTAATNLSSEEYFSSPNFFKYFQNMVLRIQFFLPGVFEGNPLRAVNGSLWSLPSEFLCYLTLGLLGLLFVRILPAMAVVIFVSFTSFYLYLTYYYDGNTIIIYNMNIKHSVAVAPYFFAGSTLFLFRKHIPLRLDISVLLAMILFLVVALEEPPILIVFRYLLIPYIVLSFGLRATKWIKEWGKHGDLSYGIYLYSFPIQQLVIYFSGEKLSLPVLLITSIVSSCLCGWASWHLVEKQALKFKAAF